MSLLEPMREKSPDEIIHDAVKLGITDFYVGFTGGKDSVVVAHFMAKNYPHLFKGMIYADTGIGTEATKNFVIQYCIEMGWPLEIVKSKETEGYRAIVKKYGFPSIFAHKIIMRKLKMIPIRRFLKKQGTGNKTPCLVSGVRKDESDRRFVNASKEIHKDHMWFVSPMIYKSNLWMYDYFMEHGLKRSPVYEVLHISGDCLCGSFSDKSEAKLISLYFPELKAIIEELEAEIKDNPDIDPQYKTWGNQHGVLNVAWQQQLEVFMPSPICGECATDRTGNSDEMLSDLKKIERELESISSEINLKSDSKKVNQ